MVAAVSEPGLEAHVNERLTESGDATVLEV